MSQGYDEQQAHLFNMDVAALFEKAGAPLNGDSMIWGERMQFDAFTLGYPAARIKHLAGCAIALGIDTHYKPTTAGLPDLLTRGQFFQTEDSNGVTARFTAIEASDFALLARFQNEGADAIRPVLGQRADCGFNMLRVWTAFDIDGIGNFTTLDYGVIPSFVKLCADYGLYVEFTAYTGWNDPLHWTRLYNAATACRPRPLLELVNELDANTNEPDSMGRVFDLTTFGKLGPFDVLQSHGSNGSQAVPVRPAWDYETFHTNDASEWWRKTGHNAMEMSAGADNGAPGSGVPCLANENTRFPDRDASAAHAYDAAAGGALLCAGSCYHSVRGKSSQLWDGVEEDCARAWAAGAKSVDITFQDGPYMHRADLETPDDLRVYERVLGASACIVTIRK